MSRTWVATPLRPYIGGLKEIELQGETVGAVLQNLADCYPGLRKHLFDDRGGLRPFVNVFLNGDDVRNLQGERTPVGEKDLLKIVPSIAGGCSEI